MFEPSNLPGPATRQLRRALRLTRAGMLAERLTRAFWPLLTLLLAVSAALMFGLQDLLPLELFWAAAVGSILGAVVTLGLGLRRFHIPRWSEVAARLDATLPGRPLQALADRQAVGSGDPASEAIWRAHQARMAKQALRAQAPGPDLRLAARDPFALRYVALLAFVMALLFGSVWRVASVAEMAPGGGGAAAPVASWEGWIEPPAYTGKPSLYLADLPKGPVTVPQGSLVTIRLYGEVGQLIVDETVSGRTGLVTGASEPVQSFTIARSGRLAIRGPGGREWDIRAEPDAPPTIAPKGAPERTVRGEMRMGFTAADDFGVTGAKAHIALDLARVDRRYGLAPAPEPREAIDVNLPLPMGRDRSRIDQVFTEDFSQHPWAGLPVTITLSAVDAAGNEAQSPPLAAVLPGRRFFDTFAMALVENRRDLLWSRSNAPRVAQVLRAISWQPDPDATTGASRPEVYLKLRAVIRGIESELQNGPLPDQIRDESAQALWDLAVEVEDGTLQNALERMREAQRRLAEAIRNGATSDEIAKLMDELRAATNQYLQMLAQQAPDGTDTPDTGAGGATISGNQIAEMMRKLQELMEQGRTAEAQALLQQLQQLLENMQVTRAPGQGGPADEAMQGLGDALRGQQELSDDTFGELNGRPGNTPPGGEQPEGQQGAGERNPDATGGGSLADRQQALREMLDGQRGALPGGGTAEGDAARDALDRAGRAMDRAEEALRQGDGSRALDDQAEAMEAMREGLRQLGELNRRDRSAAQGGQGDQFGQAAGQDGGRDPLGRNPSGRGAIDSDSAMLQGEDVYRRARELLDELRRRAGERTRSQDELDYLQRLLEQF